MHLGLSVRETQQRISSREFTEWAAFYELEPWGYEVDNYRAGLICATVANAMRGKRGKKFSAADFMPKEIRPQTIEDQYTRMRQVLHG